MKTYLLPCICFLNVVCIAQSFSAPWDVSQTAKALADQVEKLAPVLDELAPADWEAKGAPSVYKDQVQNLRDEARYLARAARTFEKSPDRLPLALETYFRMQSVEGQVGSLMDAVRKYQTQALGDKLQASVVENSTNRDQLRQYISDLATTREQEVKVIDQEAQRCRDQVMRLPFGGPTSRPQNSTVPKNPAEVKTR